MGMEQVCEENCHPLQGNRLSLSGLGLSPDRSCRFWNYAVYHPSLFCILEDIIHQIYMNKERKRSCYHFEFINPRQTKKYKFYFFDYLYYRLYLSYKKHNEMPRFSACILLTMNCFVILLFLSIIFNCVLTDHWFSLKNFTVSQGQYISLGLGGMCFILLFLRYTHKRTAAILLKYKSNKWNNILPTWMICISPLLLLFLGVGIGKLIFN